jgi:hypothetical protein
MWLFKTFFTVLGIEPSSSCMLVECCITELHIQPLKVFLF